MTPTAMKNRTRSRGRFSVGVTSRRTRPAQRRHLLRAVFLRPRRPCVPRDRRPSQRRSGVTSSRSPKGTPTAGIPDSPQVRFPAASMPPPSAFLSSRVRHPIFRLSKDGRSFSLSATAKLTDGRIQTNPSRNFAVSSCLPRSLYPSFLLPHFTERAYVADICTRLLFGLTASAMSFHAARNVTE